MKKETFSDDELMRYSRHIMLSKMDVSGQLALANSKVLIVGLGGLGSAVAQYLAAAGVGYLILVDDDYVEESNLQRQVIHNMETVGQLKVQSAFKYISKVNPHIRVTALAERLQGEALLKQVSQVDIVIDCSDNFLTRKSVNQACFKHRKPLVSGAAIRMEGQLTAFDARRESSPCYQCLYDISNEQNLSCSESGVLSPLVGVIGCSQAMEAIKMIAGIGNDLVGRVQFYDGLGAQWREFGLKKDPSCRVCGSR